jgi:flagellar assembly protein FliH
MSETQPKSWLLPDVAGPVVSSRSRSTSASDLTEQQRLARQQSFEEARRQGFANGMQEAQRLRDELQGQVDSLAAVLEAVACFKVSADVELVDELSSLALSIGKQLARRELRLDPAQVAAIVRETIALLPANSREIKVYLHPDDAVVLRDRLAPATLERAWDLLEDPVMSRGGCRVASEHASIDARFESRVAAILAQLLPETSSG